MYKEDINQQYIQYKQPICCVAKNKDESVRLNSQSGGAFSSLSNRILEKKGIVYGCALNEKFEACHIRGESIDERNRMRGSKYVQSHMSDILRRVFEDLLNGKEVLFSGTSCQIAGLKAFLNKDYSNLYCIDILCHGVVSPAVWKKYLDWQQKKHGNILDVNFRDKKYGWHSHYETLKIKTGEKSINIKSNIYASIFYGHYGLRPACYHCPYKSILHPGDITIADAWGIENTFPGFDDNIGCSLILVNNDKGKALFEKCCNELDFCYADITNYMQPPLIEPFPEPEKREIFWKEMREGSFERIAKKYGGYGFKSNIKKHIIQILERFYLE